ncbi:MAG: type I methionyl aminopeptidase [bacterium]
MILLKNEFEIDCIRKSSTIGAKVLLEIEKYIEVGITTYALNAIIEDIIKKYNAVPAFKGYRGFPYGSCISINEEVIHGIPGKKKIKENDIVSIDVGIFLNGYFGDVAKTFCVGEVNKEKRKLVEVAEQSLYKAIEQVKVNNKIGDISFFIQNYVEMNGFSVVRDFVGHGIGKSLHEEPQIPNFGIKGQGCILLPGMVLAIETMVNMGNFKVKTLNDKWTIVTCDNNPSAHFEHTVVLTTNGVQILSLVD